MLLRGLTPAGVAHSWLLGTLVYSAFGAGGYVLICLYFLLGSAATKVRLAQKQAEGIAEARGGQRGPASVWGSGLAAALCAVLALYGDTAFYTIFRLGCAASLASKARPSAPNYSSTPFEFQARASDPARPCPARAI